MNALPVSAALIVRVKRCTSASRSSRREDPRASGAAAWRAGPSFTAASTMSRLEGQRRYSVAFDAWQRRATASNDTPS